MSEPVAKRKDRSDEGAARPDQLAEADELASAELVPEDDAVIGVAFRRSVLVLAVLAAAGGLIYGFTRGSKKAAPEQVLEASAPETVVATAEAPTVRFTDITATAGIDFVHVNGGYGDKLLPETMGGGVAFFDADNDGDQDLLFVSSSRWPHRKQWPHRKAAAGARPSLAFYRNDGHGGFADATVEVGFDVSFYGMGVAVADYDADGDSDVFFSAVGENRLFRNDDGTFRDVTSTAGVAGSPEQWSTSAGFFDHDGDGDLDLFVCNYVRWSKEIDFEVDFRLTGVGRAFGPPQSYQGTFPYLYRNDGVGSDGTVTFTDVSEVSGLHVVNPATGAPMAKSLALAPVDVDGDGLLDVLIANDTVRNFFFHNLGDGTFEEVGEGFGIAYDRNGNATGAMGIDSAYYRNDHNLGFMIGNFANEMSSVYVAQDDPEFFVDEAIGEGIGAPSRLMMTFGLFLFDYDLDGRLDMLQANGHVEDEIQQVDPSQFYRQPTQLFWNGGDDGFIQVAAEASGDLAREMVGRGAAFADIDGDGDLDAVITQIAGKPLLVRNDQDLGNHWLRVRLIGKAPNRDAIGSWIELSAGGVVQRRQVMPTRSYLSQVESTVTFGLGKASRVDSLTVRWADGSEQVVDGGEVDRLLVVEQAAI